jgi:hypothetical protein
MTKTLAFSFICLLLLGFIEQSNGQNVSNKKKLIIEQQVASIFHEMIKAAEILDYDKLYQGVDDRYHAGFIVNNTYFERYDSLHNIMKTKPRGVSRQSVVIQKEKITVLSEKIVLLTACGDAKVDVTSGNSFTVKFFWSFVYEKINKDWKVVYSHQSNNR